MSVRPFEYSRQSDIGDWKCIVHQEPWNNRVVVYLAKYEHGILHTASIDKAGTLVLKEHKTGEMSKPFLQLPHYAWEAIVQVIGAIVPDEQIIEAGSELKATKFHLEDMRRLVFGVTNSPKDEPRKRS